MRKLSNALVKLGFTQAERSDGYTTVGKASETGLVVASAHYFAHSKDCVALSGFWSIKEIRALSTWMATE